MLYLKCVLIHMILGLTGLTLLMTECNHWSFGTLTDADLNFDVLSYLIINVSRMLLSGMEAALREGAAAAAA